MSINWYSQTIIENKIPDFNSTLIKEIKGINYYMDFNEFYDKISFLEISFYVCYDKIEYLLKIKFNEVTSLCLDNIGGCINQLSGFNIINLSDRGFEISKKYLVEDYENEIIMFNCSSFEVLSLEKSSL